MGDTSIEWTDASWNPVRGAKAQWNGTVRFVADKLAEPLTWKKPKRVFVNSMSDLFHEGVSFEQIAAIFGVMAACPQHTFQVLTKRPERARAFFEWLTKYSNHGTRPETCRGFAGDVAIDVHGPTSREAQSLLGYDDQAWPLANVWLGVSVEDQASADKRIPHLLECPAAGDMTAATDCLECPKCSMPYGAPLLGKHYATFTGAVDDMRCLACGHRWREDDLDKCAQAWRAECAYAKSLRDEAQP